MWYGTRGGVWVLSASDCSYWYCSCRAWASDEAWKVCPMLTKIFGRAKMTYQGVREQAAISDCCRNRDLMPRWRGPEVMEDDREAMGFVCHQCGREFLPADVQGRRLIRDE